MVNFRFGENRFSQRGYGMFCAGFIDSLQNFSWTFHIGRMDKYCRRYWCPGERGITFNSEVCSNEFKGRDGRCHAAGKKSGVIFGEN
mgnify:CR=1 FL=1